MKWIKLILVVFLFFSTCGAFAREVKFIQITDINLDKNNAPNLSKTIKEINQYGDIDFVVFGGNNIAKANIENLNTFVYLLKKLHKKTYVLLGSTDVLHSSGIDKKYYLKRVRRALKFRHSSKPNYVFKKKGYVFIAMDGSKQYFQSSNGYYSEKELMWLDKKLDKYKDKNVIILQHFPITQANSGWLQTAKVEDYWKVIKNHNNVKAIISGHYGYNKEEKIDGVHHIVTSSYDKKQTYKIINIDLDDDFIGTYLVGQ